MAKKFIRRTWGRYSKLGKRRKKKQVWRRPTGRDNKMREKRKGYPSIVSIGYKTDKKTKGKIKGKNPVIIKNVQDLEKIKKNDMAVIGGIGKKKKIEIAKKAKQMKIKMYNINAKTFLKKVKVPKKKTETKEKSKDKKPRQESSQNSTLASSSTSSQNKEKRSEDKEIMGDKK